MVRLNLNRRFPDTITRHRFSGSGYDEFGEWQPAAPVATELRCSVQPLALEDSDFVGGAQTVERLKIFVPASAGDLRAASPDGSEADSVTYKGVVYVVEESRTWPKFTRAVCLRET